MKKRAHVNLPQKKMDIRVKFEEEISCDLKMSMKGVKAEDVVTDEQKKEYRLHDCSHRVWPAFMPQCIGCLKNHNHKVSLLDKHGREFNFLNK